METDGATGATSRARQLAIAALALLAIVGNGFYLAYVATDAGWRADEHVHAVAAATMLGLVAAAALATLVPRARQTGVRLLVAIALAQVLVFVVVGDPDNHGGQAGVYDLANFVFTAPLLWLAWVARDRGPRRAGRGTEPGRPPVVLRWFALAVTPLAAMAGAQALVQRNSWPPASDPHHQGHWATTGQLALVVLLLVVLAAFARRGWHGPALAAAVAGLLLGGVSVAYDDASTIGAPLGAALVLWALGLLLVLRRGAGAGAGLPDGALSPPARVDGP